MQETILVGVRFVDYVSKTGKTVRGYSLYFNETSKDVVGYRSYDAWVSVDIYDKYFSRIEPNTKVSLSYNRYGSVIGCEIVK